MARESTHLDETTPEAKLIASRKYIYKTQSSFIVCVCFTSYFVFSIAVLQHSPGVVYYHLLLR